jgi:hypothetical protein
MTKDMKKTTQGWKDLFFFQFQKFSLWVAWSQVLWQNIVATRAWQSLGEQEAEEERESGQE